MAAGGGGEGLPLKVESRLKYLARVQLYAMGLIAMSFSEVNSVVHLITKPSVCNNPIWSCLGLYPSVILDLLSHHRCINGITLSDILDWG